MIGIDPGPFHRIDLCQAAGLTPDCGLLIVSAVTSRIFATGGLIDIAGLSRNRRQS